MGGTGALGTLDGSGTLVAADLRGSGTVVAADLRGSGASASITGPFGIDAPADDLVAVLDRIGASTATIVGHSMGGLVAVTCVARHPERIGRVVLVEGGLLLGVEGSGGIHDR